jgi:hypothetical protein
MTEYGAMESLDIAPIFESIWKWLPIFQSMSGSKVTFGEEGMVTFEFDQRRVQFETDEEQREIAVLEPASASEASIHGFRGKIIGERFECVVEDVGNFLTKRLRLTIKAARKDGPMRELVVDGLFGALKFILPGIISVAHQEHHKTHVAYAPDCEALAQVVGALALMNLISGSSNSG